MAAASHGSLLRGARVREPDARADAAPARWAPAKVPGRLFRKYVGLFVAGVLLALLPNGLLDIWFQYQSQSSALVRIQREQALAAGAEIEQFVKQIQDQVGWTTQLPWVAGAPFEQRRFDALRLLRQVPAISELAELDATGREQLRVSRLQTDIIGSGADFSNDPKFTEAVAHKLYFGPVYFRRESEPYMTLAVAGARQAAGVSVAEVNLRYIWDVVSQIKVGEHGHALVVDANGRLIAHPDLSLVLRYTDLSSLTQVRLARTHSAAADVQQPREGRDVTGRRVLTAYAKVEPLGWLVFVELPTDEAYAPLYSSMERSGLALLGALLLAVLAGTVLARRMVGPIQALESGAARIGGGDLGHRISMKTGDELEGLASQFNEMAGRLQKSYADLEGKIEALRRVEAYLSAGQSIVRTGSWAWAVDTGEVYWSQEVFRILGFDPGSYKPWIGASAALLPDEERLMFHQRLEAAVRERSEFAYEYRIMLPDGSKKYVRSVAQPFVNAAGALEYIGVLVDVTDQRRGEDALRDAQADLARVARLTTMGELAASIAHEVNQPLMAIATNAETCLAWLAHDKPDLEEVRQAAERIVRNSHRAAEIIRTIRALARKSSPEMMPLDLNEAIAEVLNLMQGELRRHDILLETELRAGLEPVVGDRVQLQQVVLNLVVNGIEAMSSVTDRPHILRVNSFADAGGGVLVEIADTGVGIEQTNIDRMFDAFFTTKPNGIGMGLSICRSIIEAHGGRLWASANGACGSVFRFTVPASAESISADRAF
jgi:C4-dicarboxylate-specific signal transduction histidine kinase